MPTFPRFGSKIPFAEPAWYRGNPTPYYQEKHAVFRAKVRAFVDTELSPNADRWDEAKTFPIEEVRRKAYEAGMLSPWCPVEYGGTPPEGGWDEFMNLIWNDELARCGSAGLCIVTFGIMTMALPHVLNYGSEELKQTVAVPVIKGETGISITLTEPQGGSDLAQLTTTAVKTPCGKFYIVNGVKKFITGAFTSRYFATAVRTGGPGVGGVSMLVIDKEFGGVSMKKIELQGWWASNTGLVVFEDVKVPVGYLLGQENQGFRGLAHVMNGERLTAIYTTQRQARMALQIAIDFARKRRTFGKRLIDHQVIQHKIAHMAKMVESLSAVVEALTFRVANGARPQEVGGPIALLKVQGSQALEHCVREASQVLGGASFQRSGKGQRLERSAREVRVAVVGGGSEEVMLGLAMRQSKL